MKKRKERREVGQLKSKADTGLSSKPQGQGGRGWCLRRAGSQGSLSTAQTGWTGVGQEVRGKAQQEEGEELQIGA